LLATDQTEPTRSQANRASARLSGLTLVAYIRLISTEAMLMFFAILTFVTAASVNIPSVSLLLLCAGIGALIVRLYL